MSDTTTRLMLELFYLTTKLNRKMEILMTTQAELGVKIDALTAKAVKIGLEVSAIKDLLAEAGGAGGTITPELMAKVDALDAQLTLVDDLNPDAPTE